MSFIAKNPMTIPEIETAPPIPLTGTRGLFAKSDGWYDIDNEGNMNGLQYKTDDALKTTDKTVVGAINEIDTNKELEIERIKYYGDPDIIPSDESYFVVNETGKTITGLTDTGKTQTELVIPYKINGVEITTLNSGNSITSILEGNSVITKVVIPNSVTSIGDYAFYGCTSLTSITIPNSVTSIGVSTFRECTLLTSINIPNIVTTIGDRAFYNCTSLTSVEIPNSVTSIRSGAFYGCTSLTSIIIPNSITSIDNNAFRECTSLTSIIIPNSITSIDNTAFTGCTNLTIYCEQGSYAETFANNKGFNIVYTDISKTVLNNKVDKETGKGLSANDFTDDYKTKLEGIAENAEVNVQSDWNETDTAKDAYIHNKPSIYTRVESDNRYLPMDTITGTVLQTEYAIAANAKNYQVYGNSTQATRSGKNLLPYPYAETTKTENGITFTVNEDGTITANGTNDGGVDSQFILTEKFILDKTKRYYLSVIPSGVSDVTCIVFFNDDSSGTLSQSYETGSGLLIDCPSDEFGYTNIAIRILIANGVTVTNLVFKPQLEIGTAATEYEQYGVMPSPDYPSEIQSVGDLVTSGEYAGKYDVPITVCGKNLINLDQGLGTVLVKNNNGTYTLTKVSASVRFSGTIDLFIPKETQITLTLEVDKYTGTSSRAVEVRVKFSDNSYATVNIQSNHFSGSFSKDVVSCVLYQNDSNADGAYTIFKNFQIESGTSATAYEPYRAETKHIYLDEPLRKLGNYADYIDYEQQKVIRNIVKIRLTGPFEKYNDIIWQFNTGKFILKTGKELCSHFRYAQSSSQLGVNNKNATGYYVCVSQVKANMGLTLAEFNTWLTENEVYYYAVLVTPTEAPIILAPMPLGAGTNSITTGTAIQPSNVIVDYYQNPTDVINSLKTAIVAMQSQTE